MLDFTLYIQARSSRRSDHRRSRAQLGDVARAWPLVHPVAVACFFATKGTRGREAPSGGVRKVSDQLACL
ncbi:protein of unknown function (plasmid) [Pararobbsia alpina]